MMLSWVGIEDSSREQNPQSRPRVGATRPPAASGVGSLLIRDVLERAEKAGEPVVMVEGIPAYYPRFGFERASVLGFVAPDASTPMRRSWSSGYPATTRALAGRIVYPAAFDHLGH